MGVIRETKLNRFDGGISNDPRDPSANTCRMVTNFDVITNPRKMTQYRSSESGDNAAATSKKQNFCIALRTGTIYSLYALGVKSGVNTAEVLYKDLTTSGGGANDLADSTWANTGNHQSSADVTEFKLFVYYAKTGRIYGARGGTNIWKYDPSGSAAWANSELALTYTNIEQGIVHSKDDVLYVPYDNKIAKNNNGLWAAAALTLPTHYVIRSICEYGNYLAIAAAPLSGIGNSRVFLWDRDSTLSTLSESIDWGSGELKVLEEIDGLLVGISIHGNRTSIIGGKVIFRYLIGNRAERFKILTDNSAFTGSTGINTAKQKRDNRIYFTMITNYNGSVRDGVWSIGRSAPEAPFALVHERTSNNDTALTTADGVNHFIFVEDYLFISYLTGGTYALSKTVATSTYGHNSIYETKRFDAGDPSLKKDLQGVTVTHEYLPAAGSVTVKYRKDEETSWTTILTNTTDNSISKSAVNIESSGAHLPTDYKEIEFQIIATGAEITGFSFKEEITDKRPY